MKARDKSLRNITKTLLGVLLFILISLALSDISPLEFKDSDLKNEYDITLILASPLIVFLLIILDYLKNSKKRIFMVNFILGIPISFIALVLVGFLYLVIDPSRGDEKTLFLNRFEKHKRIIQRTSYWDGDQRNATTHQVIELNRWFQWTQKTDTTSLSPYKWRSLKK